MPTKAELVGLTTDIVAAYVSNDVPLERNRDINAMIARFAHDESALAKLIRAIVA